MNAPSPRCALAASAAAVAAAFLALALGPARQALGSTITIQSPDNHFSYTYDPTKTYYATSSQPDTASGRVDMGGGFVFSTFSGAGPGGDNDFGSMDVQFQPLSGYSLHTAKIEWKGVLDGWGEIYVDLTAKTLGGTTFLTASQFNDGGSGVYGFGDTVNGKKLGFPTAFNIPAAGAKFHLDVHTFAGPFIGNQSQLGSFRFTLDSVPGDPSAAPLPTSCAAGFALLGVVAVARRRVASHRSPA